MKRFKSRIYFRRHIKIHDPVTAVVCEFCPKTFKYKSYKKRHMKICRMKLLDSSLADMAEAGDDTDTIIEVTGDNLVWQYEAAVPNTEELRISPYQSCFDSLGFLNLQDWYDWLLSSEMLNLPYSADGSSEGFDVSAMSYGDGAEKVVAVNSTIGHKLSDQVVELSEQEQREVEEMLSTVVYDIADPASVVEGPTTENPMNEEFIAEATFVFECTVDVFPVAGGSGLGPELDDIEVKQKSVSCHLCGSSGFRNTWFLKRHLSQMHSDSVKCGICDNIFIDKFTYLQHSRECFFWCSKPGCSFHEKRKGRVESHERSHLRDS